MTEIKNLEAVLCTLAGPSFGDDFPGLENKLNAQNVISTTNLWKGNLLLYHLEECLGFRGLAHYYTHSTWYNSASSRDVDPADSRVDVEGSHEADADGDHELRQ